MERFGCTEVENGSCWWNYQKSINIASGKAKDVRGNDIESVANVGAWEDVQWGLRKCGSYIKHQQYMSEERIPMKYQNK